MMPHPRPERPAPGQESVWDYPRPPRLEPTDAAVEVVLGGVVVAATRSALRVLETSHPPTYYLPREAFVAGRAAPAPRRLGLRVEGGGALLSIVER